MMSFGRLSLRLDVEMSERWVRWGLVSDAGGSVPPVVSARQSMPGSYAEMPNQVESAPGRVLQTVRACSPFRDAMSLGVILPMPFDLYVNCRGDGSISWWWGDADYDTPESLVVEHPAEQTGKFVDVPVLKLNMPYFIRTSDDLLVLYGPLVNRSSFLTPMSGLVNHGSDGYRPVVNMVCRWDGPKGVHRFGKGEPLAQLMFVPRADVDVSREPLGVVTASAIMRQTDGVVNTKGLYRRLWRSRRGG